MNSQKDQHLTEISQSLNDLSPEQALEKVNDALRGSELEALYFFTLMYQVFKGGEKNSPALAKEDSPQDVTLTHPYSILAATDLPQLPVENYDNLRKEKSRLSAEARQLEVTVERLQAGTGTSFSRKNYLAKILGRDPSQVSESAKGVDLFVPAERLPGNFEGPLSLAELQLLQEIHLQKKPTFKSLKHRDLLSQETQEGLSQLWRKKLPSQRGSYKEYFLKTSGLERLAPAAPQSFMPALDNHRRFTSERVAPTGHGFFGFRFIMDLAQQEEGARENSFTVISNGEDLNGLPPPEVFSWMKAAKAPVLMITTEKTALDLKGGQIALCQGGGITPYAAIVERAQTLQHGQTEYFEKLGLRAGDRPALFNTNMVIFQTQLLQEKLWLLRQNMSFLELALKIAPDVILNPKEQIDARGERRVFTQLEGAMGSVYLNLDRLARENGWSRSFAQRFVSAVT